MAASMASTRDILALAAAADAGGGGGDGGTSGGGRAPAAASVASLATMHEYCLTASSALTSASFASSQANDTLVCISDDLLVDPSANVERCVICYRIPLSPRFVSVSCRKHIVCIECGQRLRSCPMCRRRVQALYRNLDTRRINNSVQLRCPFNEFGCKAVCGVEAWKSHVASCEFESDAWKSYVRQHLTIGSHHRRGITTSCLTFLASSYRRLRLRTRRAVRGQRERSAR